MHETLNPDTQPATSVPSLLAGLRIGQGYDVHALVEGRALWLGGVQLAHPRGLLGHSDADVLLHAICDALLGAAALGDIGKHFPDSDPRYRGIDSKQLLTHCGALLQAERYHILHLDATVIAEAPRIGPYVLQMRAAIAQCLGMGTERISIKATTNEKLGFAGREEGIAALAVALLYQS